MKLYWGPHSCAIEIAALLDEVGMSYEAVKVDTAAKEQRGEAFRAMNPKGKLPTLVRDDGSVVTEFPAIAHWIAHTHPEAGLWPTDHEDALRASEMMDYTIDTIHGQGFRRFFFPHEFCKDKAHEAEVKEDGKAIVRQGYDILERQLGDRPYAGGAGFSIADATIFYTTRWATRIGVPIPAAIAALGERVGSRPAFKAAVTTLV